MKGDDDQAKKNLFINIKKGFETINVKLKLNKLKKLLIDCIKKNKII
ncbi:Flagellar biosynthesis protein FliZ [Crocosphaera watsonii WH 0401]|uniref:Flagellar biosynthesis protein FliZ n=1 Tax=Crocosphaera watsonii WH 0401 TaxID=555881 RepID=T2J222_CROWT|nr:Flagellar biosynthesis protein FliZ [Crocosphaera watsonii WH 0401]